MPYDIKSNARIVAEEGSITRYYDLSHVDPSELAEVAFVARELHEFVHGLALPLIERNPEIAADRAILQCEQVMKCAQYLCAFLVREKTPRRRTRRRAGTVQTPAKEAVTQG